MEQAGRDPSRDPQHDRTLDAMMSNTHTRAARESEDSKPSELGRRSRNGFLSPARYCLESCLYWRGLLLSRLATDVTVGYRCRRSGVELLLPRFARQGSKQDSQKATHVAVVNAAE